MRPKSHETLKIRRHEIACSSLLVRPGGREKAMRAIIIRNTAKTRSQAMRQIAYKTVMRHNA